MKSKRNNLLILACALLSGLVTLTASSREPTEKHHLIDTNKANAKLGTRKCATLLMNGSFPDSWVSAAGGDIPPKYLQWPIPGRPLGRGFGSNNGKHLAVDISADVGTPVHAMAPGIVGYADDGIRGYGKSVMVIHPGGWVTHYAHLSRIKVKPGQRVARDQVIALTGNTGISRGPHLHFALIIRGRPTDPMRYMHDAPGHRPRISRLFDFLLPVFFAPPRS